MNANTSEPTKGQEIGDEFAHYLPEHQRISLEELVDDAIAEAEARGRREGSRSGLSLGDRALLEKFDRLADSVKDGEAEMSEECKLYKHRYCVWQQCACDCHHDEGEAE